jgi:hypothetical protein
MEGVQAACPAGMRRAGGVLGRGTGVLWRWPASIPDAGRQMLKVVVRCFAGDGDIVRV